jgi:MSHA pilin protein MshD
MSIRHQRGLTLIEQIVFMIVIGVGVVGLVSVMGTMIRTSADPMVSKQSLAIAEAMLNEVLQQPNTWCDPDDANASTALSYAGCASVAQSTLGANAGESRNGGAGAAYDNVRDYAGYAQDDVADPAGDFAVSGYRAEVAVAEVGASFGVASDAALAVTVTVCRTTSPSSLCSGRESFSLTGYRFRYAPRI